MTVKQVEAVPKLSRKSKYDADLNMVRDAIAANPRQVLEVENGIAIRLRFIKRPDMGHVSLFVRKGKAYFTGRQSPKQDSPK